MLQVPQVGGLLTEVRSLGLQALGGLFEIAELGLRQLMPRLCKLLENFFRLDSYAVDHDSQLLELHLLALPQLSESHMHVQQLCGLPRRSAAELGDLAPELVHLSCEGRGQLPGLLWPCTAELVDVNLEFLKLESEGYTQGSFLLRLLRPAAAKIGDFTLELVQLSS